MKLGIAAIIKNFKIKTDSRVDYPIKMNPKSMQIEPVGGFMVEFEKI